MDDAAAVPQRVPPRRRGANEYVDIAGDAEIPLLYATTTGAPNERSRFHCRSRKPSAADVVVDVTTSAGHVFTDAERAADPPL